MRHTCVYTRDPDFHCGQTGPPEVVQGVLADLKIPSTAFSIEIVVLRSRRRAETRKLGWRRARQAKQKEAEGSWRAREKYSAAMY